MPVTAGFGSCRCWEGARGDVEQGLPMGKEEEWDAVLITEPPRRGHMWADRGEGARVGLGEDVALSSPRRELLGGSRTPQPSILFLMALPLIFCFPHFFVPPPAIPLTKIKTKHCPDISPKQNRATACFFPGKVRFLGKRGYKSLISR